MDSKAKKDTLSICERINDHAEYLKKIGDDEKGKEIAERTTFEPGRKLLLDVEVTDREMSGFLFNWLYGKEEEGNQLEYFGLRLSTIHFGNQKEQLKEKLIEFLNTL